MQHSVASLDWKFCDNYPPLGSRIRPRIRYRPSLGFRGWRSSVLLQALDCAVRPPILTGRCASATLVSTYSSPGGAPLRLRTPIFLIKTGVNECWRSSTASLVAQRIVEPWLQSGKGCPHPGYPFRVSAPKPIVRSPARTEARTGAIAPVPDYLGKRCP